VKNHATEKKGKISRIFRGWIAVADSTMAVSLAFDWQDFFVICFSWRPSSRRGRHDTPQGVIQ
jgi:hypothetical protein